MRDADDRLRGSIIEGLLCRGEADTAGLVSSEVMAWMEPFRALGLVRLDGSRIYLAREALPYARTIAARFDRYRLPSQQQRFSNAI